MKRKGKNLVTKIMSDFFDHLKLWETRREFLAECSDVQMYYYPYFPITLKPTMVARTITALMGKTEMQPD